MRTDNGGVLRKTSRSERCMWAGQLLSLFSYSWLSCAARCMQLDFIFTFATHKCARVVKSHRHRQITTRIHTTGKRSATSDGTEESQDGTARGVPLCEYTIGYIYIKISYTGMPRTLAMGMARDSYGECKPENGYKMKPECALCTYT